MTRSTPGALRQALRPRPIVAVLAVTSVLVAVGVLAVSGAFRQQSLPGLPAPSETTSWLLASARQIARVAQLATVGGLLLTLLLPAEGRDLQPYSWLATRWASRAATVWALAQALLLPLTAADLFGLPVTSLSLRVVDSTARHVELGRELLLVAVLAAAVALLTRWATTYRGIVISLIICAVAVLPQASAGHTSSGRSHQIAVSSLALHLVGVLVWAGGLVALCVGARRIPRPQLHVAVRRFSALAAPAAALVAASGVVLALVRVGWPGHLWWSSAYGRAILAKIVLMAALLAVGVSHRRRTLPALESGDKGAFTRIATVEAFLFAVTLGVAGSLSRLSPPSVGELSATERLIGIPMPPPPTAARLLTDVYPEPIFTTAILVALWMYALGVRRLRTRGITWPLGRTLVWVLGCLVVLMAMDSGLTRYAAVLTWAHMVQHLLLSMVAAPLMVLGAPITLALRAIRPSSGGTGARELILAAVNSRFSRVVATPGFAVPFFALSPFVVYFTGIYELSLRYHFAHLFVSAHFLLAAYLFFNVLLGVDPLPHRPSHPARVVMLLLTVVAHTVFGIALMQSASALVPDWLAALNRPWPPSPEEDARIAGGVAWVFGEVPFAILLLVIVSQWISSDEREQKRGDRAADLPASAEADRHAEYNAMLAELARQDSSRDAGSPS